MLAIIFSVTNLCNHLHHIDCRSERKTASSLWILHNSWTELHSHNLYSISHYHNCVSCRGMYHIDLVDELFEIRSTMKNSNYAASLSRDCNMISDFCLKRAITCFQLFSCLIRVIKSSLSSWSDIEQCQLKMTSCISSCYFLFCNKI